MLIFGAVLSMFVAAAMYFFGESRYNEGYNEGWDAGFQAGFKNVDRRELELVADEFFKLGQKAILDQIKAEAAAKVPPSGSVH
jgi:hypothetical protein